MNPKILNVCDYGHRTEEEIRCIPDENVPSYYFCKKHFESHVKHLIKSHKVVSELKNVSKLTLPEWEKLSICNQKIK